MLQKFIDYAKEQALKSPMNNKYGAVLIYRNKIIASGFNYYTHNKFLNNQCLL